MIDGQEGERFVDEAERPIAPKSTWNDLTTSELIDVKLLLEDKLWTFQKQPAIASVLKQSLKELTALIASRSF